MPQDTALHSLSPVTVLPGVGKTRAAAYARLGILTLGDLVSHFPRAYENRGDVRLLSDALPDGKCSYLLTVATQPTVVRLRSHKSFLKFRAFDDSASCEVIFFNQDYLKSRFVIGSTWRFYGKLECKGYNKLTLPSPVAEPYAESTPLPPVFPVYRTTEGLSQNQIVKDVFTALELLAADTEAIDPLPEDLRRRRALCTLSFARKNIHLPQNRESLAIARRRLVYDEFFRFSLSAAATQKKARRKGAPPCPRQDLSPLLRQLPYRLTAAQERVIGEIAHDLASDTAMHRMIVGDVGCGKTVCAAAALWIAVQNGKQAALMAPTEILARQHAEDLAPLFERMGVPVALLVGATPAAEKRRIRESLASGALPIVIGTHALLSDGVEFSAPALVVTDEQHRFGAKQRALLSEKNKNAHLLVMSATPIPRSLALVLYGDLDVSRIDEMPPGRQRVDTFVVDESYRDRLNGFIRKQVAEEGGQVYIVCPAIEDAEESPDEWTLEEILSEHRLTEERPPLKAAATLAETLAATFPSLSVALLHGKMKSAEKEDVMQRFAEGSVQILVSTTVIEVGVNVPNATLMIVENAERFGLSQLHQLRGRVGRGTRKSYCILVAGEGANRPGSRSYERLDTMRRTYDGYAIAEADLIQRGPGDFLAASADGVVRQSGGVQFRLADAGVDVALMNAATEDARAILSAHKNATLPAGIERILSECHVTDPGLIS